MCCSVGCSVGCSAVQSVAVCRSVLWCVAECSKSATVQSLHRAMGWLRLVGSLKLQVSFAEYSLFYRALLQKRPIILRSLLTKATPYSTHQDKHTPHIRVSYTYVHTPRIRVLQCVLQCGAVCCSMLRSVAVCCSIDTHTTHSCVLYICVTSCVKHMTYVSHHVTHM